MHRIFIPPLVADDDRVTITDPIAIRHLADVLRLRPGEPVECFDGQGRCALGRVSTVSRRGVIVDIAERATEPLPTVRVTLALAVLKSPRFEWAVQKATELGVSRIIPMLTKRTVARPVAAQRVAKAARWQRVAQEAARQCGRATVPTVEPVTMLPEVLERAEGDALLLPTLAVPSRPLAEARLAVSSAAQVVLLIGPEGDFTPEEVALAVRRGALPVSLGRLTLRSETAALVGLTLLQHDL